MRVCRYCGQIAPDPAAEPICHGPDGLVTSHSYRDVDVDDPDACRVCGESVSDHDGLARIRCLRVRLKEEGAACENDSLHAAGPHAQRQKDASQ